MNKCCRADLFLTEALRRVCCLEIRVILCKGKGKFPVLFLIEHHAMKAYWGVGGIAPHSL
jgi:hypothetical protein